MFNSGKLTSMRISVVSFSSRGGAGTAASSLAAGLFELGFSTKQIFATHKNVKQEPLRNKKLTIAAAIDSKIVKKNTWASQFSQARFFVKEDLASEVQDSQILIFRWSVGLFGMDSQVLKNKKVIWTLPDQAWFTGGCHNSINCEKYKLACKKCPAVHRPFQESISKMIEIKSNFFDQIDDLTFVAHSERMLESFSKSTIGARRDIKLIPNAIAPHFSKRETKRSTYMPDGIRILLVVNNIEDPIKGFFEVAPVLKILVERQKAQIRLVGEFSPATAKMYPEFEYIGPMENRAVVRVMDESDVLLVPSVQESASNIVPEAGSRRLPSLIRKGSGVEPLAISDGFGLLYESNEELFSRIKSMDAAYLSHLADRAHRASKRHNYLKVAAEYATLWSN